MAIRTAAGGVLQVALVASLLAGVLPTTTAHGEDLPVVQDGLHGDGVDESGFWNVVTGFATKTGFRMVFAWDSDEPILPLVEWGYRLDELTRVAHPVGDAVDTAGIVFLDNDERPEGNKTVVYFRFVDESGGAFATVPPDPSPIQSFVLGNAMQSDTHDDAYEVNLVVALDSEALPSDVPADLGLKDLVEGIDIFAERVWDYTDGYLRIGEVLLMDRVNSYPTGPVDDVEGAAGPVCVPATIQQNGAQYSRSLPDVIIETVPPFDSHTKKNAVGPPMITNYCYGAYLGREGWLYANPWTPEDLGAVLAHEFGHYALNLDDLYRTQLPGDKGATCWEGTGGPPGGGGNWDISVMHNGFRWDGERWVGSELDSLQTPCSWGGATPSWTLFNEWYPEVPLMRNGNGRPNHFDSDYQLLKGNPDGGALDVYLLDREPGLSKLQHVIQPLQLPPPPEATPSIVIGEPIEGQAFNVDRIDISGFVDRGYPDLPLVVDAHGPYVVNVGEEAIVVGTAANGVGPYEYEWSTEGPGVFADSKLGITRVAFSQEGSYQLTLRAWDKGDNDPFKSTSSATDTATITVLPIEAPPAATGCPPMDGLRLSTDSTGDSVHAGPHPLAELVCLGAALRMETVASPIPVATQEKAFFSFQLSAMDLALPSGDVGPDSQQYLISFVPDFSSSTENPRNGVQQWIYAKWIFDSLSFSGDPIAHMTACWLLLPPESALPSPAPPAAPRNSMEDYCDPARSVTPFWSLDTFEVTFDLWAEIGTPKSGDQFVSVYGASIEETSQGFSMPSQSDIVCNFNSNTRTVCRAPDIASRIVNKGLVYDDLIPNSLDETVTFAGPRDLAPSLAPPQGLVPTGSPAHPQEVAVDPPRMDNSLLPGIPTGSRNDPLIDDPPGDSPYPAFDILGVWLEND
ncbi:MAG TPA: PKD domain-containing protein, partial [Candidatus Thermoplasmatota archaeon]|nr:PKD domain-containing protein [Candidatus Thermoplasmatota archaeon]